MRVYCSVTGREAAWRKDNDTKEEGYFATPPGTAKHLKINARRFPNLSELAHFLVLNPD